MSTAKISIPTKPLDVLILAAGLGTRMKSTVAKVLHKLDGRPLVAHVCRTAAKLDARTIYVVVGHQAETVQAVVETALPNLQAGFVNQVEQRGTGDAVLAAEKAFISGDSTVLILSGDVPLVKIDTLRDLIATHEMHNAACTILTVRMENPTGYGRIVRDDGGQFRKILEQRDANEEERQIREVNSGIYCFDSLKLFAALKQVRSTNDQGEYYLTDVPSILKDKGDCVRLFLHSDVREVSGINTRAELAEFENLLRRRTVRRLMIDAGVTFIDPSHAYISSDAQIGRDCIIHPGVHVAGSSVIGEACELHPGSHIVNSRLGNRVTVKDHCLIVDSDIADDCSIGPFAHLRMGTRMHDSAVVGNFVEVKKSTIGRGTKSMHLTYLGDATIGEHTNIGAGTVTCNYDGKHKHPTTIGDNVRIGSDTMLVAPVSVGDSAVTAAGSVVIEDVPPKALVAGVPAKLKKKFTEDKS
ncbi:MAG TPA: bifunctional UDP-N-acetylglucosamine diphosphorylase/glucosamine-1-phosphate N-acetyltransferase GlmU [Pyrinomonadaceae bacterium]|jgi:bifunctional UDP-N-acetylglucosamine pyrophosphorylase/glucosamine-1-phosphate N-acetyltransferase|nr:bifunctional UDP-N-acetylglucosamine diphosphorylase/glucosamine-1-phosphate N-acetyltransferase GlmU [Pyrinomonadaceae bacterium]